MGERGTPPSLYVPLRALAPAVPRMPCYAAVFLCCCACNVQPTPSASRSPQHLHPNESLSRFARPPQVEHNSNVSRALVAAAEVVAAQGGQGQDGSGAGADGPAPSKLQVRVGGHELHRPLH